MPGDEGGAGAGVCAALTARAHVLHVEDGLLLDLHRPPELLAKAIERAVPAPVEQALLHLWARSSVRSARGTRRDVAVRRLPYSVPSERMADTRAVTAFSAWSAPCPQIHRSLYLDP